MKKLFISQPMRGKSDEEILAERKKAIELAQEMIGEPVEVIDSFFQEAPADAKPLWFLGKAVEKILWFYRGGKAEKKEEKKERYKRRSNRGPAFSFSQDAPYIYAAFKEQYGIDLLSQEKLHWWKFLALFESLGEETKMAKIMYYRTVSTSGMSKDRRAFINEMKKAYKLDGGKKLTLEERNQQWKEYVKKRNQERTVK